MVTPEEWNALKPGQHVRVTFEGVIQDDMRVRPIGQSSAGVGFAPGALMEDSLVLEVIAPPISVGDEVRWDRHVSGSSALTQECAGDVLAIADGHAMIRLGYGGTPIVVDLRLLRHA